MYIYMYVCMYVYIYIYIYNNEPEECAEASTSRAHGSGIVEGGGSSESRGV